MTDNKINFLIEEPNIVSAFNNSSELRDFLTGNKYNTLRIVLEPFQVVWLGISVDD